MKKIIMHILACAVVCIQYNSSLYAMEENNKKRKADQLYLSQNHEDIQNYKSDLIKYILNHPEINFNEKVELPPNLEEYYVKATQNIPLITAENHNNQTDSERSFINDGKFYCSYLNCNKFYTSRDTLYEHISIIHEGKRFACNYCKGSTESKDNLIRARANLRRHTKIKHPGQPLSYSITFVQETTPRRARQAPLIYMNLLKNFKLQDS